MKKSLLVTSSLILALGITGCSNNSTNNVESNKEETSINHVMDDKDTTTQKLSEIKSLIEAEGTLQLPSMPLESITDVYFLSELSDVITDGVAYQAGMNVHLQDVMVIQTSDVDAVKDAISSHLESDSIKHFEDGYGGEQNIDSVKNAVVNNIGNYVYYIAAPNSTQIEEAITSVLNK